MKCKDCGISSYRFMGSVDKYNCPHCSVIDITTGEA